MYWKKGRVLENTWGEVVSIIYKLQGKARGGTEQFSHSAPKIRLHTNSTWVGLPFQRGCEHLWHQGGVCRHTEVAFGSRVAALELFLKLAGLMWWEDTSEQGNHHQTWHTLMQWCFWVFYMPQTFLSFSVLHTCNLVERITEYETCTTIFGLQSPGSEFYTGCCHQTYINLFQ